MDDPYRRSYFRQSVGKIEFRYFKELSAPKIRELISEIPRFEALDKYCSFYVDDSRPEALQAYFGRRIMFRKDLEGKTAAENGGTLLYTLGSTGMVAVILYPAKSSLGQPLEDHIYLRIGHYSGYQIQEKLPKDLRDLVAYSYVSSLDAEPIFPKSSVYGGYAIHTLCRLMANIDLH